MSETIEYYEKNAQNFADSTADIKFSELQDTFLAELKKGASVLDFGCGSGRDTLHFLQKGFNVTALDGSVALCRIAEAKTGIPVIQMDFNDFNEKDRYDGKCTIDHFVPWSYVANDEIWNLHPTTKSINSAKSNHLPRWDLINEKVVIMLALKLMKREKLL